jgi:hypothetical protein
MVLECTMQKPPAKKKFRNFQIQNSGKILRKVNWDKGSRTTATKIQRRSEKDFDQQ